MAFESTQRINQHSVSLLAGIFLCESGIIPGLLCHMGSELSCTPGVSYSLNTRLGAEGVCPFRAGIAESMDKTVLQVGFVSFSWDAPEL